MGCVGCDALGDVVVTQLHEQGVTGGILRNRRAGTAYGIVVAPPGMDRIFFEDPGCNGVFTSDDLDYETIAKSRLFHFGYPPLMKSLWVNNGEELQILLARVRELGVATSLDMALPDPDSPAGKADWRNILAAVLPYVDIFVPSIEEILFMMEPEQYARVLAVADGRDMVDAVPQELVERIAEQLLDMGVKILMIKTGHRGAYIRTGNIDKLNCSTALKIPADNREDRGLWVKSLPVDPCRFKNACGAGDCAVAGFLTALLNGTTIEEAARYAMCAGRDNLYGVDAYAGLSDWGKMTDTVERDSRR
jgi:sugar/nucleoside kinase (ribokinase family)